jgi:beta-lactamase regulating signal transducer with metallopeptidase domain
VIIHTLYNIMTRYILEFLFCSGLFVALYRLLIEGRVAHHLARTYLVGGMLLSVVIPMLELPLYPAETVFYELPVMTIIDEQPLSVDAQAVAPVTQIDWSQIFSMLALGVYVVVFALNVARFVYRLWIIRRLRRHSQLSVYEAYTLAESEQVKEPFSFWRTIFMNYVFCGREREQVIIHDLSHVRHRHTAERLTLELLRCVFWFNPFVWLAANALVEVQEWEADSDVLNQGYDVYEYRQIIFRQLFGYNADITCGLNSQLTKKRFLMMTNFKRGKLSFIRLGVAIPMVGAMILAFGAVRAEAVDNTPAIPTPVVQNLPDEEKSTVYISADGKITFNDEVVTLDELKAELEKLRAEKGTDAVLTIKADNTTRLISIQGVKDVARQSGVLRVKYISAENEVDKVLPPIPTEENGLKVVTDIRSMVAEHNLLLVFMNGRGDIMTARPDGKEAIVSLDELKSIVKQFVDNTESINHNRKKKNPNYSDFKWETIKRGAGEVHYPVSQGIVSVQARLDVDAEKYLALHSTIIQAYAELREELAQRSFKQSFESLGEDDRRYIMQAIPIKVSEAEPQKLPLKKR